MLRLGLVFLACIGAASAQDTGAAGATAGTIVNPGFEAPGSKTDPVPGWKVRIGARNGGEEPLNLVEIDRGEKHSGKASLHLSASASTLAFQSVSQSVEVRIGGTYQLTAHSRTEKLRHEQNARGINQFNNCYVALFAYDGADEVLVKDVRPLTRPETKDWEPVTTKLVPPKGTRRVDLLIFSSISGEVWLDDLELTIEGGEPVPAPAVVFSEDFEALDALPPAWLVEEGARNGGDAPASTTEVAVREGAHKSKHSLHLAGSNKTFVWNLVARYFDVQPGDAIEFAAQAKAEKVRPEKNVKGIDQFANLHMHLVFLDEAGQTLGAARYAHPGEGSYDWKEQSVRGVAPEGAVRGKAGIFLSMSGDAWFDDITLTRQGGGIPAYEGWTLLETEHLRLRFPGDHPAAATMAEHGARLEEALGRAATALGVEIGAPITVFLYRDGVQGQALTGRELAYAEPERRAVHQDLSHTPGHELTHVLALQLGYAQTGLFGEGLAVWLNGAPPDVHHDTAASLLASGELPSMDDLLHHFRDQKSGYPAAGSFCGWFIETHGLEAFRRLYPLSDPAAASDAVLKQPWTDVDAAWRAFLTARDAGTSDKPGG